MPRLLMVLAAILWVLLAARPSQADATPGCGGHYEPKCEFAAALYQGQASFGCGKGQEADLRNGGECWSCPKGYNRTLAAVTDARACAKDLIFGPWAKAKFHGSIWGCPAGSKLDIGLGSCWACPAHHNRSAWPVDGPYACTVEAALTCDSGLVLELFSNSCTLSQEAAVMAEAVRQLDGFSQDMLTAAWLALALAADPSIGERLQASDATLSSDVASQAGVSINPCVFDRFNTWTLGLALGVDAVAGGAVEKGAAIDIRPSSRQDTASQRNAHFYAQLTYGVGLAAGAGVGLDYGCWVAENDAILGNTHGAIFDLKNVLQLTTAWGATTSWDSIKQPGVSIAVGIWFNPDTGLVGDFQGYTITPIYGVGLGPVKYVRGVVLQP